MARHRRASTASTASIAASTEQELSSMYDYLAKIILLGPSGCGKSCLLHRFVKDEWRILTSQTIGVEFASKIVKVGTGNRRKRIKLQLWDTAGTERFRSVSRSYYRGAAGAILVYDVCSHQSFGALSTFLHDATALASPHLTLLLAGNKSDLAEPSLLPTLIDAPIPESVPTQNGSTVPSSFTSSGTFYSAARAPTMSTTATAQDSNSSRPASSSTMQTASTSAAAGVAPAVGLGNRQTATVAPNGREVSADEASAWASKQGIKAATEVSALSGDGVEELFTRLARMILTRIELGEIDPDDPQSGIQYGDSWSSSAAAAAATADGSGSKAGGRRSGVSLTGWFSSAGRRRRPGTGSGSGSVSGSWGAMREWEEVFRLDSVRGSRRGSCC